jgi:hypothetical protein
MRIRDGDRSDPGSGMEKVGSGINIPDPQHRDNLLHQIRILNCFWALSNIIAGDVSLQMGVVDNFDK